MVKSLLFLAIISALISCNPDQQPNEQEPEKPFTVATAEQPQNAPSRADTETEPIHEEVYIDSFAIKMDSLKYANIKLPPIYSREIISGNNEATEKFTDLATASRGKIKVLVNSDLVAKEIVHTINTVSQSQSDLLLLIDKTGSMADDINMVKESLWQIIDTITKYQGTRLAVAFYGDKNCDGTTWYSFKNFETDYSAARQYIEHMSVWGGGDWPESAYDAIMKSLEQDFWQSTKKRNLILVGDAPPLEPPLSDYNLSEVIARSRRDGIIMNFYPIIITPTVAKAKIERSELIKYQQTKLSTSLYPNPSQGIINVGFEESGKYYMEIYNAAGEEIISEETHSIFWTRDLGNIPNGMYILRIIKADHKYELIKFIVQR